MDRPYKNPDAALKEAFKYSREHYQENILARMRPRSGSSDSLVGLEKAGQAGIVLSYVASMENPLHTACVVATYSHKFIKCDHCYDGMMMLPEYHDALQLLMDWSLSLFSGMSVRQMREAIIRSYFEKGIKIKEEAERLHVPLRTAYDQKSKIWQKLKDVDAKAQKLIGEALDHMCKE